MRNPAESTADEDGERFVRYVPGGWSPSLRRLLGPAESGVARCAAPGRGPATLRGARAADIGALLGLINGYAARGLLLWRSEASLRSRLAEFVVAAQGTEGRDEVMGCGALAHLGPGLGEVLALTRHPSLFEALGFVVTRRERFPDKLRSDCGSCLRNPRCDEVALVWTASQRSSAFG